MSKIVVETECEVICQAQSKPAFVFGVVELPLAVSVTEETGICRQTEMPVYCVAYSGSGSYAYAVSVPALLRDIIVEFNCALPKDVESVEGVYEVPEVRCYGVSVAVYAFLFAVFVTHASSQGKTPAETVANFGCYAYCGPVIIVVVPEAHPSTYVYLRVGDNCRYHYCCSKNKTSHIRICFV